MQQVSPLVKQIGQLMDSRFKTFEINIKAEIIASEERTTKKLRTEIMDSEERTTKKLRTEIMDSEARVTNKLQMISDKLDRKINDHEERMQRLEKHTVVS